MHIYFNEFICCFLSFFFLIFYINNWWSWSLSSTAHIDVLMKRNTQIAFWSMVEVINWNCFKNINIFYNFFLKNCHTFRGDLLEAAVLRKTWYRSSNKLNLISTYLWLLWSCEKINPLPPEFIFSSFFGT